MSNSKSAVCGGTIDGSNPDKRVKIEYQHSGFILTNSHETLGITKGFGVKGLFSSGSYRLPWSVGTNKLKYDKKVRSQ